MLYLLFILISLFLAIILRDNWIRLGFSLLSPAGMYAVIWSFVWLVQIVDPYGFYDVRTETVVLSFMTVLMVGAGEYFGHHTKQAIVYKQTLLSKKIKLLFGLNAIVVMLITIATAVSVYFIFGNPLESGVGRIIKEARGESGVGMMRSSPLFVLTQYSNISRSFIYVLLFSAIPFWLINKKMSVIMLGVALLSSVITDLSWGSRTLILDCFFTMIFLYALVYKRRRVKIQNKNKKFAFVLIVLSLGYVGQLITESTREQSTMEVGGIRVPYSVGQLGLYYSSPLVTFDQTFEDNETTYGLMSFGGLVNVFHLLRLYRNDDLFVYDVMYDWEVSNPYYGDGHWNKRANTYSWLRYLYSDFGVIGLVLVPLVLGFVSGYFYKKIALNPGVYYFDYIMLSLCFYVVVRSPVIMPFRTDYIVLAVIMLWVVHKIAGTYSLRLKV